MKDLQLILRMYLGSDAPEGPGWYIYALSGENPVIPAIKVAPIAADKIGAAFDSVYQQLGTASGSEIPPMQIVGSGHNLVRQKLQQELAAAEAAAQRIQELRASLQMLEGPSGKVESVPRETGE